MCDMLVDGRCGAESEVTLQDAYNNSANPEIVLNNEVGSLNIQDSSTPLSNIFQIQSNGGAQTYMSVNNINTTVNELDITDATNQISIVGTNTVTLNVPMSSMTQNSVISIPSPLAATDTVVLETQTQTLSNKTLLTPTFEGIANGPLQVAGQIYAEVGLGSTITGVTGDGTAYQIPFNTILYQVGSGFDTTNGVFTAPITGIYKVEVVISLSGILSSNTRINITLNSNAVLNNIFDSNLEYLADSNNNFIITLGRNFRMTANTTIYCILTVYNNASSATKNINIVGGAGNTLFIAQLLTAT